MDVKICLIKNTWRYTENSNAPVLKQKHFYELSKPVMQTEPQVFFDLLKMEYSMIPQPGD